MVILTIIATKGGAGKTSVVANSAAVLADMGFRVLCIDTDVQPSLSKYYPLHYRAPNGIVELLLGNNTEQAITSTISNTVYPNLDIILSNNIVDDVKTNVQNRPDRAFLLRTKLTHPCITDNYDIVLIDTQGSVGVIQDAAAFAARMGACGTECIVLAHLSKENNTPQLAYDAVDRALRAGGVQVRLYVAPRDELSPAYETEGTPCRR